MSREDPVQLDFLHGSVGLETHVLQRSDAGLPLVRVVERSRVGDPPGHGYDHAGVGAPGDQRLQRSSVNLHQRVEYGVGVGGKLPPAFYSRVGIQLLGGREACPEGSQRWCRRAPPCPLGRLPRWSCYRPFIRPSMDRDLSASPVYSMTWPMPPLTPIRPMIPRARSLAVTPKGSARQRESPWSLLGLYETLCGEGLFDLGGADAQGQGAERSVGGGVAVSTDDGLTRLRVSLFWGDDVDNALVGAVHVVQGYPELFCVPGHGLQLLAGHFVGDGLGPFRSGHVVVHGAMVSSGRRIFRPVMRRPSKACGDVTSCTSGGRCTAGLTGPAPRGRRGCPRFCQTWSWAWACLLVRSKRPGMYWGLPRASRRYGVVRGAT